MAFDPSYMTIKDGNTSSSNVAGRTTMAAPAKEQPKEQVQGPLSMADNRVPDIKQ